MKEEDIILMADTIKVFNHKIEVLRNYKEPFIKNDKIERVNVCKDKDSKQISLIVPKIGTLQQDLLEIIILRIEEEISILKQKKEDYLITLE